MIPTYGNKCIYSIIIYMTYKVLDPSLFDTALSGCQDDQDSSGVPDTQPRPQ